MLATTTLYSILSVNKNGVSVTGPVLSKSKADLPNKVEREVMRGFDLPPPRLPLRLLPLFLQLLRRVLYLGHTAVQK